MDDFFDMDIYDDDNSQSNQKAAPLAANNKQNNVAPAQQKQIKRYTGFDFEREVFGMDEKMLKELLEYKMNIILQGAPGVGKTYTAKRLAYYMLGCKDDSKIVQVQFHQSYNYDDFVMGLKPTEDGGFRFDHGPFYNICKKAENDPEHGKYFIIIDEINRGNMSKILGEAFSLIEKGHRNEKITMKYNSEVFSVPDNLYIIGTMNTADRGLVMLDYALRRRFAFFTVEPQYRSDGFRQILISSDNIKLNKVAKKIIELNKAISQDDLLGPGFQIGHSYFCIGKKIDNTDLRYIIDYEILPLLDEYWYDSPEKIEMWRNTFHTILNSND